MRLHPLTIFGIHKYYHSEPKLKGVYSRNNVSKTMKDRAYLVILDEYR